MTSTPVILGQGVPAGWRRKGKQAALPWHATSRSGGLVTALARRHCIESSGDDDRDPGGRSAMMTGRDLTAAAVTNVGCLRHPIMLADAGSAGRRTICQSSWHDAV